MGDLVSVFREVGLRDVTEPVCESDGGLVVLTVTYFRELPEHVTHVINLPNIPWISDTPIQALIDLMAIRTSTLHSCRPDPVETTCAVMPVSVGFCGRSKTSIGCIGVLSVERDGRRDQSSDRTKSLRSAKTVIVRNDANRKPPLSVGPPIFISSPALARAEWLSRTTASNADQVP